jgi:hypothetical protein
VKRPDYETWSWVLGLLALVLGLAVLWGHLVDAVTR